MIEDGKTGQDEIDAYLELRLSPARHYKVDAAVIGCTHYSFITKQIKNHIDKTFSTDCSMFDGRVGTAMQLRRVLDENGIACGDTVQGSIRYFTSGHHSHIKKFQELFDSFQP
jgi:glutamate racemase